MIMAVHDAGEQQKAMAEVTIAATMPDGWQKVDDGKTRTENFNATIIKQTVSSVSIDWNLIEHAEVYKIEKYHNKRGWEKVAWTSSTPATIEHLAENFGYRFRIKALKLNEAEGRYVELEISEDIIGITEAALPTTICLQRAIKKGQQFLVKRILRRRPSLIEYPGPNGHVPLANAIIHSDMCIIDLLLTEGASVHGCHVLSRRTPLQLAFYHGRLSAARILLNKKANLEATDCNGMTAAHFAMDANQCEMLKFALESGANLEARDACGWTLLLRGVVMDADVSLLKLLVTHGADIKAVDNLRQNCVNLARMYRRTEALQYFEKVLRYRKRLEQEAAAAAAAVLAAQTQAEAEAKAAEMASKSEATTTTTTTAAAAAAKVTATATTVTAESETEVIKDNDE